MYIIVAHHIICIWLLQVLDDIMDACGFSCRWRQLIKTCITTTKICFLLDGAPYGIFSPTCGIRQGDPLSPYLFILLVESLSRLIKKAESGTGLSGIKLAKNAPRITISCLQMIYWFLEEVMLMKPTIWWLSSLNLKVVLGKKLFLTNHILSFQMQSHLPSRDIFLLVSRCSLCLMDLLILKFHYFGDEVRQSDLNLFFWRLSNELKVGRVNRSHKQGELHWSNLYQIQCQIMLWVVTNSLKRLSQRSI